MGISELMGEAAEEIANSSVDELVIDGLELGEPVLGNSSSIVGDTVETLASSTDELVIDGLELGEPVLSDTGKAATGLKAAADIVPDVMDFADKALGAAEEVMKFNEEVEEFQDALNQNLEATVSDALDNQHEAIRQSNKDSRAAWEEGEISWEEHQANIDHNTETLKQLDAGTFEQSQGATDSTISDIGNAAIRHTGRGLLKTNSTTSGVIGLPIVGEWCMDSIGLSEESQ